MPVQKRQLTAIMFTDIVGYTALMGSDEQKAMQVLSYNRDIHKKIIPKHGGKWLKEMGDGTLASFSTISDSVYCAGALMQACKNANIGLRIGIHLGEVIEESGDVFGDGVNVASRLESIAEAGSIYVSEPVYRNIKNKAGISYEFIGESTLKNVDDPVKVYRLGIDLSKKVVMPRRRRRISNKVIVATASVAVLLLLLYGWLNYFAIKKSVDRKDSDKSIAVLPFVNMSEDPTQEHFSDGMTEEIITHLYKIGDLIVTSRTSSMGYKGTTKKVAEIADELNVANILEGSVRKADNRVRITVQLIDAKNDQHLWAENFDREINDIFAIQSEVAQKIAASLHAELSPKEKQMIENIPTENLEAYDYYLQGNVAYWSSWENLDTRKIDESIEFYRQSIALDGAFSFAYTGLGRSYWWLAHLDLPSKRKGYWEESKKALQKAIALDSTNGWAYSEMAVVISNYDWDSTATRNALDQAIKLMPNDRNVYIHYAHHEFRLGNCEKLLLIREAEKRLQPWVGNSFSGRNLMLLICQKKYQEIVSIAKKYWEGELGLYNAYSVFSASYALNEIELAEKVVQHVKSTIKNEAEYLKFSALIHAKKGNLPATLEAINSLKSMPATVFVPNSWYAAIYAALGEKDTMYEYLEMAIDDREREIHDIRWISAFDPYVDEAHFKDIMRRMWTPIGEVDA
jgi:TolB-like protein/class 3 adenylate cyclase